MASATVTAREGNGDLGLAAYESAESYWRVVGTREQLIDAGHCPPTYFPTGRRRASRGHDRHGQMWALDAKRGGRWQLTVWRTDEEESRFKAASGARTSAESELQRMPQTHQQYRDRVVEDLKSRLKQFRESLLPRRSDGFSFDDATVEDFDDTVHELISLIEYGGTRFNAKRHNERLSELRTGVARGDPGLQDFLARAVASATVQKLRRKRRARSR